MFYTMGNRDNDTGTYLSGRQAGIVACRERFQLRVEPPKGSESTEPWVATGSFNDIVQMSRTYVAQLNPESKRDIDGELLLIVFGTFDSILHTAIGLLGGNSLRAQRTLEYPGIQYAQNVSSRNEITRWFGVSILVLLYFPQVVTSGIDNDWGFGINPLNESWICDSTLRISPTHVSVKFFPVLTVIIPAVLVTVISWSIQPLLWLRCETGKFQYQSEEVSSLRIFTASSNSIVWQFNKYRIINSVGLGI